eukprot:scaffold952_cov409-Prasinococcus_capsulatus_cf.AAC.75
MATSHDLASLYQTRLNFRGNRQTAPLEPIWPPWWAPQKLQGNVAFCRTRPPWAPPGTHARIRSLTERSGNQTPVWPAFPCRMWTLSTPAPPRPTESPGPRLPVGLWTRPWIPARARSPPESWPLRPHRYPPAIAASLQRSAQGPQPQGAGA